MIYFILWYVIGVIANYALLKFLQFPIEKSKILFLLTIGGVIGIIIPIIVTIILLFVNYFHRKKCEIKKS